MFENHGLGKVVKIHRSDETRIEMPSERRARIREWERRIVEDAPAVEPEREPEYVPEYVPEREPEKAGA